MKQSFYSNGKLLMTSEYLVMDGAKALALPTRFGQSLSVLPNDSKGVIHWKSLNCGGNTWFEAEIGMVEIAERRVTDDFTKNTLIEILHSAYLQSPSFTKNASGVDVLTQLTFPRGWGLGSSSSLINNIGLWLDVNPYTLLRDSFGGSGYDIACAKSNTPIVFWLQNNEPTVCAIEFCPVFAKNIYFVYLNKKQSSKESITAYKKRYKEKNQDRFEDSISLFDELTERIIRAQGLCEFDEAISIHEKEMSNILGMPTVKEKLFPDFNGSIKSLGAWGGDFIMATSAENPHGYFATKGYDTVVSYRDMIL